MWAIILGGLIGGALRGVMGITKTLGVKKEDSINYGWLCRLGFVGRIV